MLDHIQTLQAVRVLARHFQDFEKQNAISINPDPVSENAKEIQKMCHWLKRYKKPRNRDKLCLTHFFF
jgi:hypothetical protein